MNASLNIAVADDEPRMREYYREALVRMGHRIAMTASNGRELIEGCRTTHPDLILTDPFMAPSLRPLLARSGAKVSEVPPAETFEQIRAVTRLVAQAVGEEARGETLIAAMDADLRILAAHRPRKMLTVAGWGGGGYVPGTGGLFDTMLTAAGARNVERGSFGYYDVESLIAAKPDILAYGDDYIDTPSLRRDRRKKRDGTLAREKKKPRRGPGFAR